MRLSGDTFVGRSQGPTWGEADHLVVQQQLVVMPVSSTLGLRCPRPQLAEVGVVSQSSFLPLALCCPW